MKKRFTPRVEKKSKFNPTETIDKPVDMHTLLELGGHFGHKTSDWCPKAVSYIFGEKNGIHIINVDATIKAWESIKPIILKTSREGGSFLFVGTKIQVREVVKTQAERCGAFYVNSKWLGGTLTNLPTIRRSIDKMKLIDNRIDLASKGELPISKKEIMNLQKDADKLHRFFGGIAEMKKMPSMIFVMEPLRDSLAIVESTKMQVPVVALSDTNMNPERITYPIPCNDDAVGIVQLFFSQVANLIIEGRQEFGKHLEQQAELLIQEEELAMLEAASV